ncbi:hypothetical protein BZA70DRAFT_290165 [Myxozyma melibiosi]|uniref:MICOS complex subunit MIC12 n=1 Tax=Myxozyma melibiosi TaxID=54550 RepID=A0ABR1F4S9_9ASCO
MSRISGFLTGVTFASIITYTTAVELRARADAARAAMALTRSTLDATVEPKRYTVVKPVDVVASRELGETMKDLWDEEIVKGAKFVLGTDWSAKIGGGLRRFLDKAAASFSS